MNIIGPVCLTRDVSHRHLMPRILKRACTVNLAIATFVMYGYALYGLISGLTIDEQFLGFGSDWLGVTPAWFQGVFLEILIWAFYHIIRHAEASLTGHKLFCGALGFYGLWLVFTPILQIMPPYSDEGEVLPRPSAVSVLTLDGTLAVYVWSSHIIFALFGGYDD